MLLFIPSYILVVGDGIEEPFQYYNRAASFGCYNDG